MENKNKILSYVAMGAGALFILGLFLPYVSAYSVSYSLWKLKDGSRVIFLLLGLAVAALYAFNKRTEFTYAAGGYGFFTCLSRLILNEGFDNLSIGFYLLLLASIAMLVVTFMYDESKGASLFNFNISVTKNPSNKPTQQN